MCSVVLQTILFKMTSSVKTLSLRFNNLTPAACSVLNDWIGINKSLEMLYLMSSGIDDKSKASLETSWRKNLTSQRTENWGYTFIRVPAPEQEEEEEEAKIRGWFFAKSDGLYVLLGIWGSKIVLIVCLEKY